MGVSSGAWLVFDGERPPWGAYFLLPALASAWLGGLRAAVGAAVLGLLLSFRTGPVPASMGSMVLMGLTLALVGSWLYRGGDHPNLPVRPPGEAQIHAPQAGRGADGAFFQHVVDSAPDLVYCLRLRPQPIFEYVSPAIEKLSGYRPSELYRDPSLALTMVVAEDRARLADLVNEHDEPIELRCARRDGSVVWVELHARLIVDALGEAVEIDGVARDVTQRKRQEDKIIDAERRARAQADAATLAREDLLAMVCHDLRNPLNAIALTTRLLARSAPTDTVGVTIRHRLGAIERATRRMDYLIAQLLDTASIEAGRLHLNISAIEVDTLLAEAVELVSDAATQKRISLEVSAASGMQIECDRERILQVLSNLLGNAVKFTDDSGRITVRAEPKQACVRFIVEDTGLGIADEQLPHIFERYWVGRRSVGTSPGLGLFIAKSIVEAHGGQLTVEPSSPRGSRFSFTIPTPLAGASTACA
jgi:PAS domain S-box-containing protein